MKKHREREHTQTHTYERNFFLVHTNLSLLECPDVPSAGKKQMARVEQRVQQTKPYKQDKKSEIAVGSTGDPSCIQPTACLGQRLVHREPPSLLGLLESTQDSRLPGMPDTRLCRRTDPDLVAQSPTQAMRSSTS